MPLPLALLALLGGGGAAAGGAAAGAAGTAAATGAAAAGAGAAAGGGGFMASMLPFLKQAGMQYAQKSLMGGGQGQQMQQPNQGQMYQPQQQIYPQPADLGSLLQAYNRPRTPRGYY